MSFDSQRRILYYVMNYVNMSYEIRVWNKQEFRNCNFSCFFLIEIIL